MRRVLAAAVAISTAGGVAAPAPLSFAKVFDAPGEPGAIRYEVDYRSAGQAHHLTVWRDGDRRIRRDTDGALTSIAAREAKGPGYSLLMLDRRRRMATRIGRSSLNQIGNFTEWYDLGHGLRYPQARYRLTAATAPQGAPRAIAPCRWYDLAQGGHVTHVCWDAGDHLPLLIGVDGAAPSWRVTAIRRGAVAAAAFAVDTRGYIRNDADSDIQHD